MKTTQFIYLLGAVLFAGCMPGTAGIEPPSDELIYPVGLAMTPSGRYLVALNSNFDLKYNAGTLVAIDVSDLAEALPSEACPDGENDQRKCHLKVTDPVSRCSADGGECFLHESALIFKKDTVFLGAFASDLEVTPKGDRLLIPVRGSRAILIVDMESTAAAHDVLDCGQGTSGRECGNDHQVVDSGKSGDGIPDVTLPIEPYEVTSFDYEARDANGDVVWITTYGAATHLASGEVSLFQIAEQDARTGQETGLAPTLVATVGNVIPGASGIATNPLSRDVDSSRAGEIYVTGRHDSSPDIAVLKLLTGGGTGPTHNNPYFNVVGRISLGQDLYSATDARGIAITSDGQRGYMVTREPSSLLAIDLAGRQMMGQTVVGAEPSSVYLYEHDGGTPDDPSDDRTFAFVLCFSIDRVYIIETSTMELLTTRTTGAGPQALTVDRERGRVYIANFRESTISVLTIEDAYEPVFDHLRFRDLGPAPKDVDENAIIKIGVPSSPSKHN